MLAFLFNLKKNFFKWLSSIDLKVAKKRKFSQNEKYVFVILKLVVLFSEIGWSI